MIRRFLFLVLLSAWSAANAERLLADKIPMCEKQPYVFHDMDGDGRKETICLRSKAERARNGNVYGAYIFFTKEQKSHELFSVLITDSMTPVYAHDDYFESVDLSRYKHPRFKKKLSGVGLRFVYPEKSSIIYYWDPKAKEVGEFQESD